MKYEIEDGTAPDGRALRFGFDPLEFPGFSWRGYAQMTTLQVSRRVEVGERSHGTTDRFFTHSLSENPLKVDAPQN